MDHTLNGTADKMKCKNTLTEGEQTNNQTNNHQINKSLKSLLEDTSVSPDTGLILDFRLSMSLINFKASLILQIQLK